MLHTQKDCQQHRQEDPHAGRDRHLLKAHKLKKPVEREAAD